MSFKSQVLPVIVGSAIGLACVGLVSTAYKLGYGYNSIIGKSPTFKVGDCYTTPNPNKEVWDTKPDYISRIDALGKDTYKTSLWVGTKWVDSMNEQYFYQDKMKLVTCPQ